MLISIDTYKLIPLIISALITYSLQISWENDVANVRNDFQSFNSHLKTMRDPTQIVGGNVKNT